MTRRQVRAAMRRLRDHAEEAEEENGELNLVPYLDIITNVIIFLLASVAEQIPLGNINVSSPTISQGGGAAQEQKEERPLNLTVTVTGAGFIIAASGGVMPTIPMKPNGKYDFQALTAKLMEIKAEPENKGETKATFMANADVSYDIVVETLDAMREDKDGKMLFPDIIFSAGLL